jgi:hypothetical protein
MRMKAKVSLLPAAPHRFGGPGSASVSFDVVRGKWSVHKDLCWPAIVWNDGRCWAYLHDMTPSAVQHILDCLREAELDCSRPHGLLTGW